MARPADSQKEKPHAKSGVGVTSHFILYVRDQDASAAFYEKLLDMRPSLHVPGMTEFVLGDHCILGLMPEKGIKRLLGESIRDPETTNGISRAELYLQVPNPNDFLSRAEELGARLLSPLQTRNWGDEAGYISDPDGHVIAFAAKSAKANV